MCGEMWPFSLCFILLASVGVRGVAQRDGCTTISYKYEKFKYVGYTYKSTVCSESDVSGDVLLVSCSVIPDGNSDETVTEVGYWYDTEQLKVPVAKTTGCKFHKKRNQYTCFLRANLKSFIESPLRIGCTVKFSGMTTEWVGKAVYYQEGILGVKSTPFIELWTPVYKKYSPHLVMKFKGKELQPRVTLEYSTGEDMTFICSLFHGTEGPNYRIKWIKKDQQESKLSALLKEDIVTHGSEFDSILTANFTANDNGSILQCSYYDTRMSPTIIYMAIPIKIKLQMLKSSTTTSITTFESTSVNTRHQTEETVKAVDLVPSADREVNATKTIDLVKWGCVAAGLLVTGAFVAVGFFCRRRDWRKWKFISYKSSATLQASQEPVYSVPLPTSMRPRKPAQAQVLYAELDLAEGGRRSSVAFKNSANDNYVCIIGTVRPTPQ